MSGYNFHCPCTWCRLSLALAGLRLKPKSTSHLFFRINFLLVRLVAVNDCKLIYFPKITDVRGNLSFIEENNQIPFQIKRVYYLYDVPSGATRGGHAHKALQQIIIALSGSFDVLLDDGIKTHQFSSIGPITAYTFHRELARTGKLLFQFRCAFACFGTL